MHSKNETRIRRTKHSAGRLLAVTGLLLGSTALQAAPGDPVVNFAQTSAAVDEGVGSAAVRITASAALTAKVNFSISTGVNPAAPGITPLGTATPGADFIVPAGPLAMSGNFADLMVEIIDDNVLSEPIELLMITLEPGLGYEVGPHHQFTLSIIDNDLVWSGVLESRGAQTDVKLKIISTAAGYSGVLSSDGYGSYPLGEWPVTVKRNANLFEATVNAIPVSAAGTAFNVPFTRQLSLSADNNPATPTSPLQKSVTDNLVRGTFVESLSAVAADSAHLNRLINGTFFLTREAPDESQWEPTLRPKL